MENLTLPDRTRREGVKAFSITLADGKPWGFALPTSRLRSEIIEGVDGLGRLTRTIRLVSTFGYPLEIRRLVVDLRSACDRGGAERQYESLICLAIALLRRAHDIDLTEAVLLLEMEVDDLPRFVKAVLSVVSGDCLIEPDATKKGKVDG